MHDPQFEDHSEQQDREGTNLDQPCHQRDGVQPIHSDTDMSKNPINGLETTARDGRGFNMTLDAHSFEQVYQKTSLSMDDFYNHPEKITEVFYTVTLHEERVIAVREEPNLHIVLNQRDVRDGTRTPWKLLDVE